MSRPRLATKLAVFALLGAAMSACFGETGSAHGRFVITDYGAVPRIGVSNTGAIQTAIDRCFQAGGGSVVVPQGVFTTGALFFRPNVDLQVEEGATLKGSVNENDYKTVDTRWEGKERKWISALINFIDVDHAKISGSGTIDGSGDIWTARDPRRPQPAKSGAPHSSDLATKIGHPRLIAFQNCHDVTVESVHIKNQASWGIFFLYCERVLAKDVHVRAEHNIPSSDGMDIDSCRNVHVTGCDFDVNDDDISIKSGKDEEGRRINRPSENIVIENCHFGYGHGGVAIGSEVSGGIRNVEVRNCRVDADNWAPIRIKSQPSRGGIIENITYKDIDIVNARQAVEINLAWRMIGPAEPAAQVLTQLKNVRFVRVRGTVGAAGSILGLPGAPVSGVTFEACELTTLKPITIKNAGSVDLTGLRVIAPASDAH